MDAKLQWFSAVRATSPPTFSDATTTASAHVAANNNYNNNEQSIARFLRNRQSARRAALANRSCSEESNNNNHTSSTGGGFGRWLREHLTVSHHHSKSNSEKQLSKQQISLPTQNLYCSLPREKSTVAQRRSSCRIVNEQQIQDETAKRKAKAKAERRRHSMSEIHSSRKAARRCYPDGGEVGRKMTTELQPSPPGYRQDATQECPGTKIYHRGYSSSNHHHHNQAADYIQQPPRRKGSPEITNNEINGKINNTTDRYDEQGYGKKNAPGYKNDSGYSESLGFESFSLPLSERDAASPPPTPPVRDASSLKAVCYGPGHEKYPSWPSAPECRYQNSNSNDDDDKQHSAGGGSHRSKSWTDHTNYPKEKPAQYTRPHTKRPNSTFTQQLKTVMERCEKIPAETFEPRNNTNSNSDSSPDQQQQQQPQRMWPTVDREGKSLGDSEYMVPSPPERESKALSPADLEAYVRSYQDPQVYAETELTQTGLDEYTTVQHSQQASYAQSEGYHSYVSSVDSTTTTPFLDRLRRDSEAVTTRPMPSWEDGSSREGRDSVVTTSSGSASSSETLKWHGSMSDVSVSSGIPRSNQDRWHHGSMSDLSSINGAPPPSKHEHDEHHHHRPSAMSKSFHALANDEWDGSKQLIAHSARVQTPQRHHSESVLYLERSQRKLYPVSTTKLDETPALSRHTSSPQQAQPSVAERISELEKQQQHQQQMMRYTYLDPEKRHRVSDPTLKAIQKKALLSFYERHHHQASWRSEPHLIQNHQQQQQQPQQQQQQSHSPPPQPPPRPRPVSSRRASSASDYASGAWREKNAANKACQQQPTSANNTTNGASEVASTPRHQHSNSCGSLSTDLLGPVIVGPAISIDDWVPERPPKKPHLRTAYSDRLPSPDLPPPSPPTVTDIEVHNFDDPLPPPPPELSTESRLPSPEQRHENSYFEESAHDRIKDRNSTSRRSSRKKLPLESSPTTSPTKLNSMSPNQEQPHSFHFECKTSLPTSIAESKPVNENGFASSSRILSSARSSLRYSPAQKHLMNEKIAAVRRSAEAGYNLTNQLPDLIAQKYSDSGNQRPAPQVPVANNISCRETQVEPKIKRQDSLKVDDSSSKSHQPWLSGQNPRTTQVGSGAVTSPTSSSSSSSRLSNKYQQQARNYFALPAKYSAEPSEAPPPLAPRKKISPPPRPAPPVHAVQGSQSKASYLAYRRERGAPDSEGSYKRTMSPNARLDDPVLLKVTQHNSPPLIINNNNNNNNNNNQSRYHHRHELSKSQSSDALSNGNGHRIDDHFSRKSLHNVSNTESCNSEKRSAERLSPQSVEVLNDRNRQLERERRKLAASCEPTAQTTKFVEEFYRESGVTTIEMTSQNVELLNRRNVAEKQRIAAEARSPNSVLPKSAESPPLPTTTTIGTTTATTSPSPSERKISSPAQTEQTGSNWDRKSFSSSSSSSSSSNSSSSGSSRSSSSSSNPSSPIRTSPPTRTSPTIEELTFVQRTEVVLRVNATTNDVASQTEELEEKKEVELESLAKPRKKLQEEIECEELSRDLANQLGPNDKLLPILVPVPEHKKSTDYVVDLFRVEAALQPRPRPRLSIEDPATLLDTSENESECDKKIDSIPSTPVTPSTPSATDSTSNNNSPLSASSVYFTTSESKARFLTRYSQDVTPPIVDTTTPDSLDLRQKKEELMVRLDKKLVVLRAEQEAVREEGEVNEALGARVATRVAAVARPAETSKYRLHVEEVGKITSLLLGLSGRLARAENALYGMPADHPERKILESKRDKLIDQLEEAKNLKGNIDRRSVSVSAILAKYLSDEEYADYQHFINMKAKLIVDGREIQDKVKLGEEQLAALKEAIDL